MQKKKGNKINKGRKNRRLIQWFRNKASLRVEFKSAYDNNDKSLVCFVYIPTYDNLKHKTWQDLTDHLVHH